MKKINWKNFIIMYVGLSMAVFCITDWIIAVIGGGTFTIFGLIVNLAEAAIASICYEYLQEYYNEKQKN